MIILQAVLFNRIVKQIEGDTVSAMEVGHSINDFIDIITARKRNNYLSTTVAKEIDLIATTNVRVSRKVVLQTTNAFYG